MINSEQYCYIFFFCLLYTNKVSNFIHSMILSVCLATIAVHSQDNYQLVNHFLTAAASAAAAAAGREKMINFCVLEDIFQVSPRK